MASSDIPPAPLPHPCQHCQGQHVTLAETTVPTTFIYMNDDGVSNLTEESQHLQLLCFQQGGAPVMEGKRKDLCRTNSIRTILLYCLGILLML